MLDFEFDAHARAFGRGDFGDGVFKLDVQRQLGNIDADGVFLVGGEAGDQCQPFAVGFAYGHTACADGDVRHIAGADDGETVVDLAGGEEAAAHEDEAAPPACVPVAVAALAVNVCPAVAVGVLMADVAVEGIAAAAVCIVVLLPAYAPAGAAHAAAGFVQGCLIAVVVFVSADACGGRIAVVEADGEACVETQFAPVAEVFIGAGVERGAVFEAAAPAERAYAVGRTAFGVGMDVGQAE
ncbi:hypothetical protein HMPREF3156_01835 [Neisseria sp. HMSC06F02]|nr:hypothetical protein HMPREF3156_01835 [Neisseria sp. HMSC06F02]